MSESAFDALDKYGREAELLANEGELEELATKFEREHLEGTVPSTDDDPAGAPSALAEPEKRLLRDFGLEPGVALCLSGEGYRAMLFHAGALLRLNEAGVLGKLARITSVSGGALAAGILGANWSRLEFDGAGVAANLNDTVIAPIRQLAGQTIDSTVAFALLTRRRGTHLQRELSRHVFGDATLQDLPESPRIVISATNLQSGALWRFSKPYAGDYRVGLIRRPSIPLAAAVAASAAAPLLSPVHLRLHPEDFEPGSGADLQHAQFMSDVLLTDGTLVDSLAVETAWNRYQTLLISDGGLATRVAGSGTESFFRMVGRMTAIVSGQVRALRHRQVVNSLQGGLRRGAFWGLGSGLENFPVRDVVPVAVDRAALAAVSPRMARLEPSVQEGLMNWGYVVSDAALRSHFDSALPTPTGVPFPRAGCPCSFLTRHVPDERVVAVPAI